MWPQKNIGNLYLLCGILIVFLQCHHSKAYFNGYDFGYNEASILPLDSDGIFHIATVSSAPYVENYVTESPNEELPKRYDFNEYSIMLMQI